MAATSPSPAEACDVAVVGAGLAGLAAALGFAGAGFRVRLAGPLDRLNLGRTVAVMGRSVGLLQRLGVWDAVTAAGSPMRILRMVDDTGSLFAPRPVEFRAQEIDRDAFGWNIENARLAEILAAALPPGLHIGAAVVRFDYRAEGAELGTADGRRIEARLVIGADGRASAARKGADIAVREHRYGQNALTALLRHERPHGDASTEFHTREGPFTLVPLPGTPDAPHRSSLVWVMKEASALRLRDLDDAALAQAIRPHTHGLLGDLAIEGARGLYPMARQTVAQLTGTRLMLVGDAAHVFPPIGAQGLNLGLRDVEGAIAVAVEARRERRDIGGAEALRAFASARRPDIVQRTLAVDALNRSLLMPSAPVDALRGFGLAALRSFGPLRRAAMREGVAPSLAR